MLTLFLTSCREGEGSSECSCILLCLTILCGDSFIVIVPDDLYTISDLAGEVSSGSWLGVDGKILFTRLSSCKLVDMHDELPEEMQDAACE